MLSQDIRCAFRSLRRNPGFTAVALASLALGIGANTAIFTLVNAALLKPLPYPEADRVVVLRQRPVEGGGLTPVHPRSYVRWRERAKSFESMALAQPVPVNTDGADGAEQSPGLWMTPELFQVLRVRPALGSWTGERATLVLSHGYWQRRFGSDRSVVGKSIRVGNGSAVVTGVMPAGFRVGSLNVDIYQPIEIDRNKPDAVGSRAFLCFARLRPAVSMEAASAEMAVLGAEVGREDEVEKNWRPVVAGLRDFVVGENRQILLLLAGVVGLVLLIACANLASLLLTRGVGRRNEIAVRTALGASRQRIVQQLVAESVVLAGLGGALGLFAGWGGGRVLASLARDAVSFGQLSEAGVDGRVIAFTAALSMLTAIVFGLMPAWQASRVSLQARGAAASSIGQNRARGVLVVGEVALAVVLLVGAGLLLRSFSQLMEVKLGFRPEQALTMRTIVMGNPASRAALIESMLDRVESAPGVRAAGTIQFLPLTGMTNNGPFQFVGRPAPADRRSMESDVSTVSRGYFEAIGMELLRGRTFRRDDHLNGPRVALVNQSWVSKYSATEDPIGRVIIGDWANPKPTQIVGVVNDVRHNGLSAEVRPTVFLAQAQVPGYITYFVVRTAVDVDPAALAATIRREIREVDPRQPITDVQPLQHYVSAALARPRLYAHFTGGFSALALFLAAVGLYGLLAYTVRQRTHEIGLRMALGAQPGDVLRATLWQGGRLVIAGLVLGVGAAMALSRIVENLLYGVTSADPMTYSAVAGLLLGVGVMAALIPARRAARVHPMVALRYE